jgi:Holliday junction resolvase RusA-like endonuclease
VIRFTILGEPASKANSRQIVTIGERPSVIKSQKAREFEANALRQIPPRARLRLDGPVRVTLRIFYASQRPDLDESVILDVLQDRWCKPKRADGSIAPERFLGQAGVYRNDRQVREKHVFHGIDKANPRTEVCVEPLQAQQVGLALPEPEEEAAF